MRRMAVWGLCAAVLAAGALPVTAAEHATPSADGGTDPNDTGRNVRDRDGRTLTPMNQGTTEGDRSITQRIRQDLTDRDELSTDAKNVKIITVDGVVTLRGPVKTDGEKTTIAGIARKAPGVKRVDDQVEVEQRH
jgi:hyperosmotically inducible protein